MTRPGPNALILAAHGSRAPGWAAPVEALAEDLRRVPAIRAVYDVVQTAYLERVAPTVPDAVRGLLSMGARSITVLPLLLTVSTHLSEDLPGLLGLPVPPHIRQRLVAEGQSPLPPGLPIQIQSLGDLGEILARNVHTRALRHHANLDGLALVLCAYGSSLYHARWEVLMHDIQRRLLRMGAAHAGHAYIGHCVQHRPESLIKTLQRAAQIAGVRSVRAMPMLMSTAAQSMRIAEAGVRGAEDGLESPILFEVEGILPDEGLCAHLAACALSAQGISLGMAAEAKA